MRIVLSNRDSARYRTGDPEATRIETRIMEWAVAHQVREAIVVVLDTDELAFGFCVDETGGAQ